MSENVWQPIKTAPKDRFIDVWQGGKRGKRITNVKWEDNSKSTLVDNRSYWAVYSSRIDKKSRPYGVKPEIIRIVQEIGNVKYWMEIPKGPNTKFE